MDSDYDESTAYKIVADNEHITIDSVTVDVDGTDTTYTEVSIPLVDTNTVELDEWLGNAKSKNGLTAELVGFNADGDAVFVLQIENFSIRNRLTSAGDPTPIEPEYLSEAQVRALVNAIVSAEIEELLNAEY
jgi:hypothetical protein